MAVPMKLLQSTRREDARLPPDEAPLDDAPQPQTLLSGSLRRMTEHQATGAVVAGIGGALALWSLGGAMQNLMWALNIAYDREETRGFVRRRLAAFGMVFFALLGFALAFGVLV